jgi:EpsD family peptidyl-prolyl cis-trans isomerase
MKKYLFPLLLITLLATAGCGEKKTEDTSQAAAVKVGEDAISVEMLNHELKKLGQLSESQVQQATKQVLNALVDQTLLKQAAEGVKVEEKPQVQQRLEAARRQILAEAYIEHLTASVAKPSEAEITSYFAAHPELFAERQIYNLQELNIEVNEGNIQSVQAQLAKTQNLNEFAAWLKTQGIPLRARQLAKPAEQLPTPLLEKLSKAKLGQSITTAGIDNLNIIILAATTKQPVTLEQAKPVIERYLNNLKKKEIVESELKSRRTQSKIEYLSPYEAAAPKQGTDETVAPVEQKSN